MNSIIVASNKRKAGKTSVASALSNHLKGNNVKSVILNTQYGNKKSNFSEELGLDIITSSAEDGDVGNIMKDVTKLLEVSEKIPKAIDTINALEEKVKKEQANEAQILGG